MTTSGFTSLRAWPAASLAAWAAARDAGRCSPDDVLHTLHDFAQVHELDTGSAIGAPDGGVGVLTLLDLVAGNAHLAVAMPAPGDAQGLPPGPVVDAAVETGEVLLIDPRPGGADGPVEALALIARGTYERCRWTLTRTPTEIRVDTVSSHLPLGELEYELRTAVGDAADVLSGLDRAGGPATPADLRDALAATTGARRIDLPPHDNPRVDRVLASAAQIDAIVSLAGSGSLGITGAQSGMADERLRRLRDLTRTARTAAINTLITDYRR